MIFRFCYPCPTTCSIQAQRIHVFSYLHRWYLQCYDDHPTTTFPGLSFSINGDSLRIQQAQGANVRSMSILFGSHRIISSHSQHNIVHHTWNSLRSFAVACSARSASTKEYWISAAKKLVRISSCTRRTWLLITSHLSTANKNGIHFLWTIFIGFGWHTQRCILSIQWCQADFAPCNTCQASSHTSEWASRESSRSQWQDVCYWIRILCHGANDNLSLYWGWSAWQTQTPQGRIPWSGLQTLLRSLRQW